MHARLSRSLLYTYLSAALPSSRATLFGNRRDTLTEQYSKKKKSFIKESPAYFINKLKIKNSIEDILEHSRYRGLKYQQVVNTSLYIFQREWRSDGDDRSVKLIQRRDTT